MIKIGVSACFLYPDPTRAYFSPKTLCYLENDMANYLVRDDVIPVLIPDLNDRQLEKLLEQMDGFVFQGGSDVCPESYNEEYLNKDKWPGDKHRDNYELKIADYAFKHVKPILGICRGAQLLNVYFGGTLYQDLPTQFNSPVKHRDAEIYDYNYHAIEFATGLILEDMYHNEIQPHVSSVHHQGIKSLGNNLRVEAISPKDNLIEAFSYQHMDEKFVLAVQWHPEFSHTIKNKLISADPVYNYFLDAVRKQREAK